MRESPNLWKSRHGPSRNYWSFKMRKFFHETKMISAVAIFAIITAIVLDLACDFNFKGIISNVCYSVIAAYIFYLIQIYFPERKKKRLFATRIRGYILGKILDNLGFITRALDKNTKESLSEIYADLIIEAATDAYNNLFKCTDDFGQLMEDDLLDVIVGLTESQFLYDLYCLRHDLGDSCSKTDAIYDSYEEYGEDFINLNKKLSGIVKTLPLYGRALSDDIKKRLDHS